MEEEIWAKVCCRCKIEKPLNEFGIRSSAPDKHRYCCKICISLTKKQESPAKQAKRYFKNRDQVLAQQAKKYLENREQIIVRREERYLKNLVKRNKLEIQVKTCIDCGIEKGFDCFNSNKTNKLGLCSRCKECNSERAKEYRKKPEVSADCRAKAAQWRKTAAGKHMMRKHHLLAIIRRKRKIAEDPIYALRYNFSCMFRAAIQKITNGKLKKNGKSTFDILPYSIEELKTHLEARFDENMSWDNRGSYWHVDHVIPQSLLPYGSFEDENFKTCWALNNLQPLEARENMSKGNKLDLTIDHVREWDNSRQKKLCQ